MHDRVFISTQPEDSFPELVAALKDTGAKLLNFPMITVREAPVSKEQEVLFKGVSDFDWLVFTSRNGVHYFLEIFKRINGYAFAPGNINTAVIGGKTGNELIKNGIVPSFISESSNAGIFAIELKQELIPRGARVLLLLGDLAGNAIQDSLNGHAECHRINCYKTIAPDLINEKILSLISSDEYALIIFTSSSGFDNFAALMQKRAINIQRLRVASIGKSTLKTMNNYGIDPVFTAKQSNLEGIANEIKHYINQKS
jgi:uroporphyrinogen-III synthase